jgi:hypothetical protein
MLSSGHIALQAEGQPVWFRKIEIRRLAPAPVAVPVTVPAAAAK